MTNVELRNSIHFILSILLNLTQIIPISYLKISRLVLRKALSTLPDALIFRLPTF